MMPAPAWSSPALMLATISSPALISQFVEPWVDAAPAQLVCQQFDRRLVLRRMTDEDPHRPPFGAPQPQEARIEDKRIGGLSSERQQGLRTAACLGPVVRSLILAAMQRVAEAQRRRALVQHSRDKPAPARRR